MLLFGRFHSVRVTDRQADGIAIYQYREFHS